MPTEVQPPSATGSDSTSIAAQVRKIGHDLRNLITIFIGVTETLEAMPQKDSPVENSLPVLRTLCSRLQGLANGLSEVGREAAQSPDCDAAELARSLSTLDPSFGVLARAYRSAPLLRAREGDLVRLWAVVLFGAQRLGGFQDVPDCEVVSGSPAGYSCRLRVSFARLPLPSELRENLENAVQPLGATLTVAPDGSTVSVGIPVA